jgi:hypothetical protein
MYIYIPVGGFNPSEKYESQLGLLFPIYGKIKMFQTTIMFLNSTLQIHHFMVDNSINKV